MYNPKFQNSSPLPKERFWASLNSDDQDYEFIVNPESINYSHAAELTPLKVLYSDQPPLWYTGSSSAISLPKVLFISRHNNRDLTDILETLSNFTKPRLGSIPALTFKMGDYSIHPCYLNRFTYTVNQWRSGKPTQASGAMQLSINADRESATLANLEPLGKSLRERQDLAKKLVAFFSVRPDQAKSLGIEDVNQIKVNSDGKMVYKDKVFEDAESYLNG